MSKYKIILSVIFYSLAAEAISVALADGYGSGDLTAFFIWTVPFGFFMAAVGRALQKASVTWGRLPRLYTLFITPLLLGFGWGFVIRLLLGMFFGLFSFSVTLCWMAGGAAAFTSLELFTIFHQSRPKRFAILVVALLLCGAFPLITTHAFVYFSGEQELDVTTLRWFPSSKPFFPVEGTELSNITAADLVLIRKAGLTGEVLDRGGGARVGTGPKARLIFLVSTMPDREIKLPLPDRCFMIYYQVGPNQFERWPKDAKLRKEQIRVIPEMIDNMIEPDSRHPGDLNLWTDTSGFRLRLD